MVCVLFRFLGELSCVLYRRLVPHREGLANLSRVRGAESSAQLKLARGSGQCKHHVMVDMLSVWGSKMTLTDF